jgi:hypothetical protein
MEGYSLVKGLSPETGRWHRLVWAAPALLTFPSIVLFHATLVTGACAPGDSVTA